MAQGPAAVALRGAAGLLERAIGYTRSSLQLVTADRLANRTPCCDWDLRALLRHMSDSLAALQEAAELGEVPLVRGCSLDDATVGIVTTLRAQASTLLGAWARDGAAPYVGVGGCELPAGLLAGAGALEITVHGWDVAWACGRPALPPAALAEELLDLAPLLVSDQDRPARFAAPRAAPVPAAPGERLLSFLGRDVAPRSSELLGSHPADRRTR